MPENDFDSYGFNPGWWGAPAAPAPAPAPAAQMPAQDFSAFAGMLDAASSKGEFFSTKPAPYQEPSPGGLPAAVPPAGQPPAAPVDYGAFLSILGAAQSSGAVNSTRPEQYQPNGAAGNQGGGAQPASGYNPNTDYYGMGTSATFGSTYQTPDWMRTAGGSFMQDRDATNAFFAANPQYAEDWKRITSGGNSAFSTDGTSLIKTDFSSMSPEAAAHYAKNPYELMAAEGFGYDPTLQYMNYYKGPGSIGVDGKRTNVADFISKNKWTPNGIQAGNTLADQARIPFGAGFASYQAAGGTTGTGGLGRPGGSAPTGGGSTGGGGGSPGGGSSGVSSGSSTSFSSGGPSTSRQVDARNETVEGRIRSLIATDSSGNYANPLIQQAVNGVLQQFSGRGLLNSSMASEAALQAAMSKAIEIAGPDAQTYFAQGRSNQDAANVYERDARGYAQEEKMFDKNAAINMEQFDRELQYKYDALKIDKESQTEARTLAQKYAIEMENIQSVNSAYELYLRRISDIDNNPDMDAATKIQRKNDAGKDFDLYAKAKGIAWNMDLGGRFEGAAPAASAPAPAGGSTSGPQT